jgi:hypothetical protein
VTGYNRLGSGTGEMRWRLLRLIPGWWWGTDRQHEGEFFRAETTGAVCS